MAETTEKPKTEPKPAKNTVTTSVWVAGKEAVREQLFRQAIANVRDAIPVSSYDVSCEVTGTAPKKLDDADGTVWDVKVTFTPREGVKPAPVDLEKVIAEAEASYGDSHPGDPKFLDDNPK